MKSRKCGDCFDTEVLKDCQDFLSESANFEQIGCQKKKGRTRKTSQSKTQLELDRSLYERCRTGGRIAGAPFGPATEEGLTQIRNILELDNMLNRQHPSYKIQRPMESSVHHDFFRHVCKMMSETRMGCPNFFPFGDSFYEVSLRPAMESTALEAVIAAAMERAPPNGFWKRHHQGVVELYRKKFGLYNCSTSNIFST